MYEGKIGVLTLSVFFGVQVGVNYNLIFGSLVLIGNPKTDDKQQFLLKLNPPRASFMMDMTDDKRKTMEAHVGYWIGQKR